jgi:hypothetical protein
LARPIIKTDKRPTITSDFIGVLLARSLSQAAADQMLWTWLTGKGTP